MMKKVSLSIMILMMILISTGCGKAKIPGRLTFDEVQRLSSKGDRLSWQDFNKYQGTEIGSGLYIIAYPIDDVYVVLVGGGDPNEKPMYIYLENRITEQRIDIRYDNISEFIKLSDQSVVIAASADLTHDGVKEKAAIDLSDFDQDFEASLKIINDKGRIIWKESAATAHAGWNSLYLYNKDGEEYLIRYNPYMNQGYASYRYEVFFLDQAGKEQLIKSNTIDFSINPDNLYDIDKLLAFAEEINGFLKHSILLLSTEQGKLEYSTESAPITRLEEFTWLDSSEVKFEDSEALRQKLEKYQEYIKNSR